MGENICGICYEEYFNDRTLVYLNCGHNMCNECHQKLTINNEIKCPFCRNPTKINENSNNILFIENVDNENLLLINHENNDYDAYPIMMTCIIFMAMLFAQILFFVFLVKYNM